MHKNIIDDTKEKKEFICLEEVHLQKITAKIYISKDLKVTLQSFNLKVYKNYLINTN